MRSLLLICVFALLSVAFALDQPPSTVIQKGVRRGHVHLDGFRREDVLLARRKEKQPKKASPPQTKPSGQENFPLVPSPVRHSPVHYGAGQNRINGQTIPPAMVTSGELQFGSYYAGCQVVECGTIDVQPFLFWIRIGSVCRYKCAQGSIGPPSLVFSLYRSEATADYVKSELKKKIDMKNAADGYVITDAHRRTLFKNAVDGITVNYLREKDTVAWTLSGTTCTFTVKTRLEGEYTVNIEGMDSTVNEQIFNTFKNDYYKDYTA